MIASTYLLAYYIATHLLTCCGAGAQLKSYLPPLTYYYLLTAEQEQLESYFSHLELEFQFDEVRVQ